jgi:rhodanese-related sulfurtransferase
MRRLHECHAPGPDDPGGDEPYRVAHRNHHWRGSMYTATPGQARDYFAQKLAFVTGPFELDGMVKRGEPVTIVDVRLPSDYAQGHIPGAINLPKGKWHTLQGVRKDRPAVLYCYSQTCKLAAAAAMELAAHGITVLEMEGGFPAWTDSGLPVEKQGERS